jgi:hypothetical protein
MPVNENPHRPALRASSRSRSRERAGVRALPFKSFAKGAGAVVLGLVALDLVATVATLALGATWFRR